MRHTMRLAALACTALCLTTSAFAQSGRKLYETYCVACHQKDGRGGPVGANLRGTLKHGHDVKTVANVIKFGVPDTQMPSFKDLTDAQRHAIATYVLQLGKQGHPR